VIWLLVQALLVFEIDLSNWLSNVPETTERQADSSNNNTVAKNSEVPNVQEPETCKGARASAARSSE